MSRAFSSTASAAKSLTWLPVKATKRVDWIKRGIEEYLDAVKANYPQLANKVGKVTVGEIHGNPHSTPHHKGRNDPFHGSGAIGQRNLKKDDRETSLHIYPNGVVTDASAEDLGEDAVWLDSNYCEEYASGGSMARETSEYKHQKGKGKGKSKERDSGKDKGKTASSSSSSSAGGGASGWEWDNEMQVNKRWAEDLGVYVYWDEIAQAEKYWDGREWKWVV